MGNPPPLPNALQESIESAVGRLDSLQADEADAADILRVLTVLHPETHPEDTRTIGQQRVLLLGALTFQHILPIWRRAHPHDMRAEAFLQQALNTIRPRAADNTQDAIDLLWEQTDALQTDDPIGEIIGISAYTLTKAIDHAVNPQSLYRDYALETHIGVALRSMARASVEDAASDQHDTLVHARAFWRWWFTEVVPDAWFASQA